jgi:diguanylate cyclase (GGDEF)-like protein/PAS domain S-box-containing protein
LCATGIEFSSEYRFTAKCGRLVWVHGVAKMVRDKGGAPLMLHGIAFDITQRKEAEIVMRRSQEDLENCVRDRTAELAQAKEQFELAVKGSNDGIWDWNMETGDCYFSTRFKELLGFQPDSEFDLPHQFENLRDRFHTDDASLMLQALQRHLDDGEPFDVICRLEMCDASWRWFRLRGQAVRLESGRPRRMAGSLSDISLIKRAEQELSYAALVDKLTGLPNRSLLMDRLHVALDQTRRTGIDFAVMFIDFDRFKYINDSLGHDVGDALLCEIAVRLRNQLRSEDTVSRFVHGPSAARMGGDEFVVLLDEIREPHQATRVAERLLQSFSKSYRLGPHEVFSTASIGIVIANAHYDRAEDVLRDADTAMYEAKRAGKARFIVFDEAMRKRVQRRLKLETDLRKAIDEQQLALVYQPIVSLDTGEVKSVEALLRWRHPTEGMVSPAEFIPIAEESELILTIGDWVLREGVRQMADWVARLGKAAPPTVSINLSRKQFIRSDLPEEIQAVAAAAGLSPDRLQFEITEDTFASDVQAAIAGMNMIKSLGSRLAIDDFGTGCSTFASLHDFPADVLKIDRSLLTGIEESKDTAALVHSLAVLVHNLGMTMVAEGVETESNVITLRELGCQYGQGYFFAKPLPPAEFEDFALNRQATRATVAGASAFQDRWSELLRISMPWIGDGAEQ